MYKRNEIQLRELRGEDAVQMLAWENNQENWLVSDRETSLNLKDLELLIETQQNVGSIYDLDQYRFMITEAKTGRPIGTIDLYEASWNDDLAYVGILIAKKQDRKKRAGFHALELLLDKMHHEFELEFALARIQKWNIASIRLFEKVGFQKKIIDTYAEEEVDYIEFVCELEKKW
ncbi:MAG: GNAT family N-acetyltransferase [bacterium]|nr:GNAT family N-acetyltransferase [bacterium]